MLDDQADEHLPFRLPTPSNYVYTEDPCGKTFVNCARQPTEAWHGSIQILVSRAACGNNSD